MTQLLLCCVAVVQVHGELAASPGRPRSAPSVKELLVLMLEAAKKPILWYLTAAGFLVRTFHTLGRLKRSWQAHRQNVFHDLVQLCALCLVMCVLV